MMKCGEKVILFGLSKMECRPAEHYLEEYDKDHKVQMIIDNNPDFEGEFHGIPVRPQSALANYVNDETVTVIITTCYRHEEIQNILLEMGFSKNRIITAMEDNDFLLSYGAYFYKTTYGSRLLQPIRINVELSRSCNCRCIYCPSHGVDAPIKLDRGFMSWETLKAITEQIGKVPSITTAYIIGRGEPYLHPEWYEMMEYLLSNSYVEDLLIYSNGMLLNQDTVRKLAKLPFRSLVQEVSIDGETPEENNLYRIGSDYETIRRNICDATEILSGRNIKFRILNTYPVTRDYLEQHNYTIPSRIPAPEFLQRDFPAEMEKGSRVTVMYARQCHCEANGISLSSQMAKDELIKYPCINLFSEIAVTFSGDILSCSCGEAYSKGIRGILGNVVTDDLLKIWKESAVMKAYRQFLTNGKIPEICRRCSSAPISEFLVAVKSE